MSKWPADNQAALLKFYGTPGADVEHQLVPVIPPFRMYYERKPIKQIMFHRKAADALRAALNEIWEKSGRDQAKLDQLGVSNYSGAYNPRFIRGSSSKWSNHAYGAAIDINAEKNGFNTGHGNMPQFVIDAFKRQGARWGGDYHGRTDPMHFEFCDPGPSRPVTLFDEPQTDGDSDTSQDVTPPTPTEELPEKKPGWVAKIRNWAAGVATSGGLFAADWRFGVIAIILVVLATGFLLWLFGREPIKAWLTRHFA